MIKLIFIIFMLSFASGCKTNYSATDLSDEKLLSSLETTRLPEMTLLHAHLSAVKPLLEGCWKELHLNQRDIAPLKIVITSKPPKDPGVNPFDTDPFYEGPHIGCNLVHLIISARYVTFRDALDLICECANATWYIKDGIIYIGDKNGVPQPSP